MRACPLTHDNSVATISDKLSCEQARPPTSACSALVRSSSRHPPLQPPPPPPPASAAAERVSMVLSKRDMVRCASPSAVPARACAGACKAADDAEPSLTHALHWILQPAQYTDPRSYRINKARWLAVPWEAANACLQS